MGILEWNIVFMSSVLWSLEGLPESLHPDDRRFLSEVGLPDPGHEYYWSFKFIAGLPETANGLRLGDDEGSPILLTASDRTVVIAKGHESWFLNSSVGQLGRFLTVFAEAEDRIDEMTEAEGERELRRYREELKAVDPKAFEGPRRVWRELLVGP